MPDMNESPSVVVTNNPSSDLIVYRFDQIDKKVDKLDQKLDGLTGTFATKEELSVVTKRIDNYTWYWRALVSAILVSFLTAVASFFIHKG